MTAVHTDDMTNDFLTKLDEELIVSVAPTPRPDTEADEDEDEKEQNNQPAWCTLFAIPTTENQIKPMNSSEKVVIDETTNNALSMNMGMSMSGSDE